MNLYLKCEQLILLLFKKSMHVRWFEQRIAYLLWYKFRYWIPGCINTQSTIAVINQGKCVFTRFYMYVLLTYCAHSKGTWCWFWSNRMSGVYLNNISYSEPKFQHQSLSYKWSTTLTVLWYVNKTLIMFCLHFEVFRFRQNMSVTNASNCFYIFKTRTFQDIWTNVNKKWHEPGLLNQKFWALDLAYNSATDT